MGFELTVLFNICHVKVFLLNVERGDLAAVKRIVTALGKKKAIFDLNCVDPLGRSSLVIAIENENLEIVQFLLESGIEIRVRDTVVMKDSRQRHSFSFPFSRMLSW